MHRDERGAYFVEIENVEIRRNRERLNLSKNVISKKSKTRGI